MMSTGAGEGFKVAVLGAAGGIGQPLSLLMKERPTAFWCYLQMHGRSELQEGSCSVMLCCR